MGGDQEENRDRVLLPTEGSELLLVALVLLLRTNSSRLVLRNHLKIPIKGTHDGVLVLQGVSHLQLGHRLVLGA